MLIKLRQSRAQIIAEYALTIFIVLAAVTAMVVYVRRTLQARIFDARKAMINMVRDAPHTGRLRLEYEPYYSQVSVQADRAVSDSTGVDAGGLGTTGIFTKIFSDTLNTRTTSVQLPPRNSD